MGNKRPHPEEESSGHFENEARKRMRTNFRPHKARPQAIDLDSMNAVKKRARAIERLLARDTVKLPANKKNDLERELAAHKQRIEDTRAKKDRSSMIGKYHMVRFFERKKAMRFAKQLEKKVAEATDPEELTQLKADLHVAQVDIDYAIYFPFMETYISLYAKAAAGEKEDKNAAAHYLRTPRPSMWTVIEKTRGEGQSALEKLQNRRPQAAPTPEAAPKPAKKQPANNDVPAPQIPDNKAKKRAPRAERRALERARQAEMANDESDGGGFFEDA